MAVTVTVVRKAGGAPGVQETYDKGQSILVRDNGHLAVFDAKHSNAQVLAVYAPTQWVTAVVTD